MQLDLSDDEASSLATFLRQSIDSDPFPLAPRLRPLKAILTKLDPEPEPPRQVVPSIASRYPVPVRKPKRR